jgi:TPR repeat protein
MNAIRSVGVLLVLLAGIVRLSAQQISFEEIRAKAEKGDLQAQVDAGEYLAKRGNDAEAFPWFIKAALQGSPATQLRVAKFYESGRSVTKDDSESQKWYAKARLAFEEAAEHGDANAMYQLARVYDKGHGVPRSKADAYKWFSVAANVGNSEAARARDVLVRSLTSSELTEIKQKTDSFINSNPSPSLCELCALCG